MSQNELRQYRGMHVIFFPKSKSIDQNHRQTRYKTFFLIGKVARGQYSAKIKIFLKYDFILYKTKSQLVNAVLNVNLLCIKNNTIDKQTFYVL